MNKFVITHNDNGFHIQGKSYWFEGRYIELPLYATRHTYQECIEWLNENYPNNYEIVESEDNNEQSKNNPINLHVICADCEERFENLHNCMKCCGVPLNILQAHEHARNSMESEDNK